MRKIIMMEAFWILVVEVIPHGGPRDPVVDGQTPWWMFGPHLVDSVGERVDPDG